MVASNTRRIINNACPPKRSQKSLHAKLEHTPYRVCEVGNVSEKIPCVWFQGAQIKWYSPQFFLWRYKWMSKKKKKKKKAKIILPWPGFEPGLLRPQRSVLTTRRSRRATPHAVWVRGKMWFLLLLLYPDHALKMRKKESHEQTGVRSGCEIGKDRDSEIRENFAGEIRNPHNFCL